MRTHGVARSRFGLLVRPQSTVPRRRAVEDRERMRLATANKYHARRSLGWNGRLYDSRAERDYGLELRAREAAGEIANVEEQPVVPLVAGITYRPDFAWTVRGLPDGERIFADVKGIETEVFRLKAKLWVVFGPGSLLIVKRDGRRGVFKIVRTILPRGAA